MTPEKTKKLNDNFPLIFPENFYFECGDGWYDIIYTLCRDIQNHIDYNAKDKQVIVTQVKEKFGTLRFYANGGDLFTDGLISMAESISEHTCEACGNKGTIYRGGWYRTHCDPCEQEYQEKKSRLLT